jgi:hypothetical protein
MTTSTEAIHRLIDASIKAATDLPAFSRKPEGLLYHFTDAAGAIGMVRGKMMRATRASCMNDAREILHGKDLGRSIVADRLQTGPDSRFSTIWKNAIAHFDGASDVPPVLQIQFDAFAVSFCARDNRSVHWLHYGRGGHGFAVGLDPKALELPNWSLVPVTYDETAQREMLGAVFDKIEKTAAELVDRPVRPSDDLVSKIESTAGHLLMDVSSMLAPCFKHDSFSSEEEWRLFRTTAESEKIQRDKDLHLSFRASGGLVVPYAEFPVAPEGFKKITMGYQVPEHPVVQSLKLLLRESGIDPSHVEIVKSVVPVRGAA